MPPSPLGIETETLLSYLSGQREHALGILDGLDADAMRCPVLPSGWTCLGLIQHLALDVERFWFRAVVAGEPAVIASLAATPDARRVAPDVLGAAVFDRYRREIDLAHAIIAATPQDAAPAWRPADLFGEFRLHSPRQIMPHVMTETACQAGHLDAARELIDGRSWFVLTDSNEVRVQTSGMPRRLMVAPRLPPRRPRSSLPPRPRPGRAQPPADRLAAGQRPDDRRGG